MMNGINGINGCGWLIVVHNPYAPWWYIYLHWVILFGQMLVTIPWSIWGMENP
jgi:hypothetical protein